MNRLILSIVAVVVTASLVQAHMVYLVPSEDRKSVTVVFSDSLEPDEKVKMDKLAGLKLQARVEGKDVPLEFTKGDHSFTAKVPDGTVMIHGTVVYGLLSKSEKPTLLVYHPKCVFPPSKIEGVKNKGEGFKALRSTTRIGESAAFELVPYMGPVHLLIQARAYGQPVEVSGTVLEPDGVKLNVTTDPKQGIAPTTERIPDKPGLHGAYFKYTESKAGEHDGKKYEEVRHYATLVVDLGK